MKEKEILKCLCNPMDNGIWELEIRVNEKNEEMKKIKKDVKIITLLTRAIWGLLEKNSQKYETPRENLENIGLKNTKYEEEEILVELSEQNKSNYKKFYELTGLDEDFEKHIQKYLDELKDFIRIDYFCTKRRSGFDFDTLLFLSYKKRDFFGVEERIFEETTNILCFNKKILGTFEELLKEMLKDRFILEKKRKFYPESLIYENYMFLLVNFDSLKIIDNKDVLKNIEFAKREFYIGSSMYSHKNKNSIRFIGLAMEEIITEIYMTCLREIPCTNSLGQLIDDLSQGLNKILGGPMSEKFGGIKKLEEELKKRGSKSIFFHGFLDEVKKIKNDLLKIKKKLESKKKNFLFPKKVQSVIDETKYYRNISSHRDGKRLGDLEDFEVGLCMRGLIYLTIWWEYVKKGIKNHEGSKKEIIKEIKKQSEDFLKNEEDIYKKFYKD